MNVKASKERVVFLSLLIVVLAYLSPYYLNGENVAITVHDNLDANLVYMKVLLEGGYFTDWSKQVVPNFMGGVPVSSLAPIYDISALVMSIFGIFWGYVVLKTLMALAGYAGMWFLLHKFVIPQESIWITGGVAMCYGLLPYWGFGFSVALLPFMFAAFLAFRQWGWRATRIEGKQALWPWMIMVIAGFSTSLILVGFFFIGVCGLWILFDYFSRKQKFWPVFTAMILLSFSYILSHIRIFLGFLNPAQPSHRLEMDSIYQFDGWIFTRFSEIFAEGQYHAASIHLLFIPIIFIGLFMAMRNGRGDFLKNGIILINLMEFIILSSLWYAIVNWGGLQWLINPITTIVPIQLGRLHFLQPVFWYVALAIALAIIYKVGKLAKITTLVVLVLQTIVLFDFFEERGEENPPSYRGFYAENLFNTIKDTLGNPKDFKIISVGLHPAVAQKNGFYTLDGYLPDYPLSYKHRFGKVIQGELNKSADISRYFNRWGSRAYAFSAEVDKDTDIRKGNNVVINDLDYDWSAFRQMGGDYIFSAVKIADTDLKLISVFKDSQSAWDIYVYVVEW